MTANTPRCLIADTDVDEADIVRVLARYDLRTLSAAVVLLDAERIDAAIVALLIALSEAGAPPRAIVERLHRIELGALIADVHDRQTTGSQIDDRTGLPCSPPATIHVSRAAVADALAAVPSPRALFHKMQAVHRAPDGASRADAILDRVR